MKDYKPVYWLDVLSQPTMCRLPSYKQELAVSHPDRFMFTKKQFKQLQDDLAAMYINQGEGFPLLVMADRYMEPGKGILPQNKQQEDLIERVLFNRRIDDLTDTMKEVSNKLSIVVDELVKIKEAIGLIGLGG